MQPTPNRPPTSAVASKTEKEIERERDTQRKQNKIMRTMTGKIESDKDRHGHIATGGKHSCRFS